MNPNYEKKNQILWVSTTARITVVNSNNCNFKCWNGALHYFKSANHHCAWAMSWIFTSVSIYCLVLVFSSYVSYSPTTYTTLIVPLYTYPLWFHFFPTVYSVLYKYSLWPLVYYCIVRSIIHKIASLNFRKNTFS